MDERHPGEEPHELEVKAGVTLWVETLQEFMVNTKLVEETEQIRQSQLMKTFCLKGKEIQFTLTQAEKKIYCSVNQEVQTLGKVKSKTAKDGCQSSLLCSQLSLPVC